MFCKLSETQRLVRLPGVQTALLDRPAWLSGRPLGPLNALWGCPNGLQGQLGVQMESKCIRTAFQALSKWPPEPSGPAKIKLFLCKNKVFRKIAFCAPRSYKKAKVVPFELQMCSKCPPRGGLCALGAPLGPTERPLSVFWKPFEPSERPLSALWAPFGPLECPLSAFWAPFERHQEAAGRTARCKRRSVRTAGRTARCCCTPCLQDFIGDGYRQEHASIYIYIYIYIYTYICMYVCMYIYI